MLRFEWWVFTPDPEKPCELAGPFATRSQAIAWRNEQAPDGLVRPVPEKRKPPERKTP